LGLLQKKMRILAGTIPPTMAPSSFSSSGNGNTSSSSNETNVTDSEQLHSPAFETIVIFCVISSIVAALVQGFFPKQLLRVLPQPVILMIIYIVVGCIAGQPFSVEIEAEIILTIFLPPLLTNEAIKIKTTPFYKSFVGLMWLIGPALFAGAAIVAVYPYAFFPAQYRFSFNLSMAVGGMIATTDPM
jgi:NhaP-type Na+/H+ or K+/H+ antiporter